MREIKFRAWLKEEKEMVVVDELCLGDKRIYYYRFDDLVGDLRNFKYIELMQYTGLKDKNGKEIYEGDIVKFDDTGEDGYYECYDFKNVAEITFNNGRYELKNFLEKNTTVSNGMIRDSNWSQWDNEMWFEFMDKELTIIGNIYENPELLGDGE